MLEDSHFADGDVDPRGKQLKSQKPYGAPRVNSRECALSPVVVSDSLQRYGL